MSKLVSLISIALNNKDAIFAGLLALIGCASLAIKVLEGAVAALVAVFPSLKTADGGLKHIAAWLDGLSKSGWLNTLAASPKVQE